jgi:(p)ppGpp synthase/HD superfamily hydrolase
VDFQPATGAAGAAVQALREAYTGVRAKAGKGVPHAEETARVLDAAGCPDAVVLAGLLHDVVEDTPWTVADVSARCGPVVAGLVAAVTEDDTIASYKPRKRALREQIALAGPDAIDITLADKVASLRYAVERDKRVPKRKVAHYVATVAMAEWAGHPALGREVADLLVTLDARDHAALTS